MNKIAGLLTTTLLAVGLMCAPASAQGDEDEPCCRGGALAALLLGRADMIRALKQLGPDAKVADAMTKEIPTVGHRACLEEAVRLLQEKRVPGIGVLDAAGKLAGLITSETIGEMLMVREALPQGARVGPWSR